MTQAHQQGLELACGGLGERRVQVGRRAGAGCSPNVTMDPAEHVNANLEDCSPGAPVRAPQAMQRLAQARPLCTAVRAAHGVLASHVTWPWLRTAPCEWTYSPHGSTLWLRPQRGSSHPICRTGFQRGPRVAAADAVARVGISRVCALSVKSRPGLFSRPQGLGALGEEVKEGPKKESSSR